jgi:hypothetical protein
VISIHHHQVFHILIVEKKLPICIFVNIIHIKDSNKYDIWVSIKNINVLAGAEIFMKNSLLLFRRLKYEYTFRLYTVVWRIKLNWMCCFVLFHSCSGAQQRTSGPSHNSTLNLNSSFNHFNLSYRSNNTDVENGLITIVKTYYKSNFIYTSAYQLHISMYLW